MGSLRLTVRHPNFLLGMYDTTTACITSITVACRMHQDIKPANILVFRGKGNSPYDRHFKIGDLVLTSFQPSASQSNDPTDFEAFGTRAYGMPNLKYRLPQRD